MDPIAALKEAPQPRVATHADKVYREECVLSFDTRESEHGIYVNLRSFEAFGEDFVEGDHHRTGNRIYLNVKWTKVEKCGGDEEKAEAEAPTKVALGVEGGFQLDEDKYEYEKRHQVVLFPERVRVEYPNADLPAAVTASVDSVLAHADASTTEQATAWEAERPVSKYAADLQQLPDFPKTSPNPADWKCYACEMTSNLWLNLSTGVIGCGRKLWDGSGGNGHALQHYEETGRKYPLSVKLGTITPSGGDVFSYAPEEDDMVIDPSLARHLEHCGINMMKMEKTDKTMTELELDLNLNFEFDKIQEAGKKLVPVAGPGFVGLRNLGNSCYMNSFLQALASLPEFGTAFFRRADEVLSAPPQRPGESVDVQLCKLAKGLLSDRYVPTVGEGDGVEDSAAAVAPRMLKAVLGKGHPEFSSTRQQDAHEFYQHVLTMLERHARAAGSNATDLAPLFTFAFEQRTQCEQSGKVRYERRQENTLSLPVPVEEATNKDAVAAYEARRQEAEQQPDQSAAKRARTADAGSSKATGEEPVLPKVPFDACLRAWAAAETVDHFLSPATGQRGRAIRTGRFATFPRYLVIQMKRYVLAEDWSPRKLDVSVSVPDSLDLSAYRGGGLQEGEEELPDGGAAASAAPSVEPDDALVAQLASMGFSTNGCKRACIAVQNAGADAAMAWILEHMEDADFNDPPAAPGAQAAAPAAAADPNSVAMIIAMGFNEEQAKHALGETGGSVERAVDWLFSHNGEIPAAGGAGAGAAGGEDGGEDGEGKYSLAAVISHIGKSPMAGHYVCHIRKGGRWVIYNDRKVAVSEAPPLDLGYLYIFRRDDAPRCPDELRSVPFADAAQ